MKRLNTITCVIVLVRILPRIESAILRIVRIKIWLHNQSTPCTDYSTPILALIPNTSARCVPPSYHTFMLEFGGTNCFYRKYLQPLYVIMYLINLYKVEYRILPTSPCGALCSFYTDLVLGLSGGYGFC